MDADPEPGHGSTPWPAAACGTGRSTAAAPPSSTRPTPAPPSSGSSTAKGCSTRPTPPAPTTDKILPGKQAAIALQNPVSRTSGSPCSAASSSRGTTGSTRPASTWSWSCSWWTGSRSWPGRSSRWGRTGRCRRSASSTREQQEALNELAAGNVLYGETDRHGQGPDRRDPRRRRLARRADAGRVHRQRPGRPESVRARHQRPGRDLGRRRRRVPRCRQLLDEQRRACSRSGAGRPGSGRTWPSTGSTSAPSATRPAASSTRTSCPSAELEWSNGQDNLFNAASARPRSGSARGATIRQLDPEPRTTIAGQYVKDTASITAYGLRSITFDQLQTVERDRHRRQLDGGDEEVRHLLRRELRRRRRRASPGWCSRAGGPATSTAPRCGTTSAARDQRPAHAADRAPRRRRLLQRRVLRRRACTTPAGPGRPTSRSSSSPWTCARERTTPRTRSTRTTTLLSRPRTRGCTASPMSPAAPTRSPASAPPTRPVLRHHDRSGRNPRPARLLAAWVTAAWARTPTRSPPALGRTCRWTEPT